MRIIGFAENGTKAVCEWGQGHARETVLVALLVLVPAETMKAFFEGHSIDDFPSHASPTIVSSGTTLNTTTPAPT
jgi:hypothetical protein